MTNEKKIEIGNWLQNNNICYFYESTCLLVAHTEAQLDEVNSILSDWGVEHSIRIDTKCINLGEFVAYITFN